MCGQRGSAQPTGPGVARSLTHRVQEEMADLRTGERALREYDVV